MNEEDIESLGFDFGKDDDARGFRLIQMEIYNWGTFDQKIAKLKPNGESQLLTGDNGAGKSSLVDALSTLLGRPKDIDYNKAAGGVHKERSLRTYLHGYYKSERVSETGVTKPVGFRQFDAFSVILGTFRNHAYDKNVTLAMVMHFGKDQSPVVHYFTAERHLSIEQDFMNFGSEISALRRRAKAMLIEFHDTFTSYSAWYRRHLGVRSEQCMSLFRRAVSMKEVGDLTDFCRQYMLEKTNVDELITEVIANFDHLDAAHRSVEKATDQQTMLVPIADAYERHQELVGERRMLDGLVTASVPVFAAVHFEVCEEAMKKAVEQEADATSAINQLTERRTALEAEITDIDVAIGSNGGNRVALIEKEITSWKESLLDRERARQAFEKNLSLVGLSLPNDPVEFAALRIQIEGFDSELGVQMASVEKEYYDAKTKADEVKNSVAAINSQIKSYQGRQSNIDAVLADTRERLCADLGFKVSDLPFIAELIKVKEAHRSAWLPSIEKLLRGFGMLMLVTQDKYDAVSQWVDDSQYKGRFAYQLASADTFGASPGGRDRELVNRGNLNYFRPPSDIASDSVLAMIEVKPDAPLADWLWSRLKSQFDYVAAVDMAAFRQARRAVTRNGQIKHGGGRHEKDNRPHQNDPLNFILGWSNKEKIEALIHERGELESLSVSALKEVGRLEQVRGNQVQQVRMIERLISVVDYSDIDPEAAGEKLSELQADLDALRNSSSVLSELMLRKRNKHAEKDAVQNSRDEAQRQQSVAMNLTIKIDRALRAAQAIRDGAVATFTDDQEDRLRLRLEAAEPTLSFDNFEASRSIAMERLREDLASVVTKVNRVEQELSNAMRDFAGRYPEEVREIGMRVEAAPDYVAILKRIKTDDLPKYLAEFDRRLRTETLHGMSSFRVKLEDFKADIKERVRLINESLLRINYTQNTFIELDLEVVNDAEIKAFKADLQQLTGNSMDGTTGDDFYKQKFKLAKELIDRLRGRKDFDAMDKAWRKKVTDVREHFTFAANECFRADGTHKDRYTSSSGKSGGQKEKLAYTILGASLAYQYGLNQDTGRADTFRLVMIDEAFGRGSDVAARYAMTLFKKLGFQLMIITPLQKIFVIEPFVNSFALAEANKVTSRSRLHNLTMDQFLELKKHHRQVASEPAV